MEYEAYKMSQEELDTHVRSQCNKIVAKGFCSDVTKCNEAIDSAIEFEQHELEHYRSTCWWSR